MRRFFIEFKNIESELPDREFSLLDKDLFVMSPKLDGTKYIDPIITMSGFSKHEVLGYAKYCESAKRDSVLLVEIPEADLDKIRDTSLIIECKALSNGSYYIEGEVFEPRKFKLIDYGAYPAIKRYNDVNVVSILPNIIESGKVTVTEKSPIISMGDKVSKRRESLARLVRGGDLYIQTSDPEVLDDLRIWTTEVAEIRKSIYEIVSKNYFLFDGIRELSRRDLEDPEKTFMQGIINHATMVYITTDPLNITYADEVKGNKAPEGSQLVALVDLEAIAPYLIYGLENLPYLEKFRVFNQSPRGFSEITMEDALDIPRTFIAKNAKGPLRPGFGAVKMNLFYEYEPGSRIPTCLRGCWPVEFQQVDINEEGLPIWLKSEKIIKNQHNEEYAATLRATGNRAFIQISGPNERQIIEELGPTGLLQEFELVEHNANKKGRLVEHYVSRPYIVGAPSQELR